MSAYLNTLNELYRLLDTDAYIKTVKKGGLIDVDKSNVFPYSHINIIDVELGQGVREFGCSVIIMNLRDTVKQTAKDKWGEGDNENENLDNVLLAFERLYLNLKKGNDTLELKGFQRLESFTESHRNVCDGWIWRFNVEIIETDTSIC
jgi:hypothetical protein